ncbi:hypothetical protein FLJC2902T_12980 [Flavobacterium limnosediminis JC2902]|uniref:DUF3078 domain-containing protein n=1 Tax=Flavobacterium limnosediminis JC2902 TaxID=1341181 RepID=V6SRA3_9FLAO|nr:hypothetical protein [Flavobacterium limnosediminis]ESU28707.1 hypothetical protein FLJC2902T_12980 [Flavobacterium limnosediminis JC2902]
MRNYRKIFLWSLFLISTAIEAQETNSNPEFDLLKAPISPASNLLGFSQSDIDKPTDVSAFMTSLQTASNSFTQLPSNYAIDIAPYWLFKKESLGDITTKGLGNSSGKNVLKQSLVLSFAVRNSDSISGNFDPQSTYGALAFKLTINRGEYDQTTKTSLDKIGHLQKLKLSLMEKNQNSIYENVPKEIDSLKDKRKKIFEGFDTNDESPDNILLGELLTKKQIKLDSIISSKIEVLLLNSDKNEPISKIDEQIKRLADKFQLARIGFTWDISGGVSSEFRNKNFNNSKIYNAGVWTTLGYTWEKSGSLLGIMRYLYNPDKTITPNSNENITDNISTLDTGLRYILGNSQAKFNCSLEAIYRSILTDNSVDPSWRIMLNLDYAILKNQKLTFSFGRNYDGTTTKDGNLIAALGLVFGFGNKR